MPFCGRQRTRRAGYGSLFSSFSPSILLSLNPSLLQPLSPSIPSTPSSTPPFPKDRIASLVVLPTPLSLRSKLPPALAAYTSPVPFLRPKAGTTFDAAAWIASGSAYVLGKDEAASYRAPYESDPATSAALAATLEAVGDWKTLLRDVDEAMRTFRARALVVPGSADPFSDLKSTFEWRVQ